MGVYIPNMEMPKSCGECKFFCGLGYGFHCYLNGKHITFIGEVEDFCPLIDLVRCGECKHMSEHYDTDGNLPYWICLEWDSGADIDGYCYLGERRADV